MTTQLTDKEIKELVIAYVEYKKAKDKFDELKKKLTADLIPEESDVTYYAGSTFKVVSQDEDSKGTMTWNKYALPTAVKTSDKDCNQSNYTVSYKK